ncbi:wax synthase family protein [Rhodotorula paludigena]|uniref:wax synthase family protein n=1 Tax=Rhodotorula paludigena TaxID=86838 RepID=UPI00317C6E7D
MLSPDADPRALARPAFSLPSPKGLLFGAGLLALALLLQPAVPPRVSRILRLALFPFVAFLALASPFWWRFEPCAIGIPANFRWAIFAPYGWLKAVEWGLLSSGAREREFAWVGFDGRDEERVHAHSREHTCEGKRGAVQQQAAGKTTAREQDGSARSRRANDVAAPRPMHPPMRADSLTAPQDASAANSQLPTPSPSPSPPFEAIQPPSIADDPPHSPPLPPLARAKVASLTAEQRLHPLRTFSDAFHLLTSLRGIGYTWGPPLRSLAPPSPTHAAFVRRAAYMFVYSHVVSTLCLALQVLDRDGLLAPFLARQLSLLPVSAPAAVAEFISSTTSRLCIGVSLYAQMNIGFEGACLAFFLCHHATNALLSRLANALPPNWAKRVSWRSTFDLREYPPLFDRPFAAMGDGGLASFWGKRWHALFRGPFTAVGYRPVSKLARTLGLPKKASQLAGVFVVFALSGWMHWQALLAARHALGESLSPSLMAFAAAHSIPPTSLFPRPYASLSFLERHGTFVFFLLQPVAVALENFWIAKTRRRVGGWAGRIWVALWVVVLGQAVVGRSWLALGLVHGLPPVHLWSWERWLLPTFSLAPMPIFMRS